MAYVVERKESDGTSRFLAGYRDPECGATPVPSSSGMRRIGRP
jgi:hypothetical protein